ncbi:MAG: ATP-binding protein [bacterium]|nr:ATP-binding protein [bacterium]
MAKRNKNIVELEASLKTLKLSTVQQCYQECIDLAVREELSHDQFLLELFRRECEVRDARRTERLLRNSRLPLEKNLTQFDQKRLAARLRQQVKILLGGEFVMNRENVLAFGNPGSGKTHLVCAVGQELVQQGYRVYFRQCTLMVEDLMRAKRDLELDKLLKKLSRFDVLILDEIGYVQNKERREMEVLFTLLAQRYERGTVMITSNLPFSKWNEIFQDPMITAAAIDRLVHHSIILEMNLPSYRAKQAKASNRGRNKS